MDKSEGGVDKSELWSPRAREAYLAAVDRVDRALAGHSRAVLAQQSAERPDPNGIEVTAAELEAGLAALSEAEMALTGAAAFWLDLDDPDDPNGPDDLDDPNDDLDADDPHAPQPGAPHSSTPAIPVLAELQLTMDVTDLSALLAAARELDPDAPVTGLEDAIFAIAGRMGWDQFLDDQVPGITMQGAAAQLSTP